MHIRRLFAGLLFRVLPSRRATLMIAAVPALWLAACQSGQATGPAPGAANDSTGTALPLENTDVSVDRIAYLSPGGDLFTINPDGSDLIKLTGTAEVRSGSTGPFLGQSLNFNNFYAWPTWSPDGARLAASRIQVSGDQAEISVEVVDAATKRATTVYRNEVPGLIADGTPHYLYWSPDSKALAFLASAPQGLTLFVADMETPAEPVAVESGAPLYFHWAQDGSAILVHAGSTVRLVRKPFGTAEKQTLLADAQGFRVPAFSPDGSHIAYAITSRTRGYLVVAPTDAPESARRVLETGAQSAFMWSPDGRELAVADQQSRDSPIFQRLRVVSADGGAVRTVAEEPVIAFYWSPDGQRIAWVVLDTEEQMFEWKVGPSAAKGGGQVRELVRLQPSAQVFTMLSFFDQYAYSHSPWSPDSSRLVVAGTLGHSFGRRNGQTPTGDRVLVLTATQVRAAREIASGTLAFWSWN